MSNARKAKSMKIQEFYAHSAPINAVSVGRQSAHVVASGGDDMRVNIWRLGKPQPIMSLEGHSTEVDSVMFDAPEELVAAGSRGGSIKVWDLREEKLLRTLTGHRASVNCLDFHPYGDYFASGSVDTNVKIWDVRKKGVMQTYRSSSSSGITVVKHSPDGRWIVSGSESGEVKIWDLSSGKLLQEIKTSKREPVVSLDFHPNEFLLAVGGTHCIDFWDMEEFSLISSTPRDASALCCLTFSRDGLALLASTSDTVRTINWEPCEIFDTVESAFGSNGIVKDCSESVDGELICVSANKSILNIHLVDLKQVLPFSQTTSSSSSSANSSSHPHASHSLESTVVQSNNHRKLEDDFRGLHMRDSSIDENEQTIAATIPRDKLHLIQQQQQQPSSSASPSRAPSHPSTSSGTPGRSILNNPNPSFFKAHGLDGAASQQDSATHQPKAASISPQKASNSAASQNSFQAPPARYTNTSSNTNSASSVSTASTSSSTPSNSIPSQLTSGASSLASTLISAPSSQPIGLNPEQFVSNTEEGEIIRGKIMQEHSLMIAILNQRLNNLKTLKQSWTQGNVRGAIEALVKMNDLPTAVDFFNTAEDCFRKNSVLTLDMCRDMLPILKNLLTSRFESYVSTALRYVALLLQSFTHIILSTRAAAEGGGPIDLTKEERVNKCNEIYNLFKSIYPTLNPMAKKQTTIGNLARETRTSLEKLLFNGSTAASS